MEVEPTVDSNKTLSFNSSQLQELPVGHYEIELWVVNQAGTSIYPSQGYLSFTINENSIGFNGEAIPTITLHEFEERIDKLEKDLRAKADNGDFDGEKGEPGDKGDPGKDATNNDPNAVHVSGNQAISGVKNFIDTPTINGNKVLDDSLQIGGRNLLLDTTNQRNTDYWQTTNSNTDTTKFYNGSNITVRSIAWSNVRYRLSNLVERGVVNTTDYFTFSMLVKGDDDFEAAPNTAIRFYCSVSDTNPDVVKDISTFVSKTEWKRISATFKFINLETISDNGYGESIRFELLKNLVKGNILFTQPTLVRGNKATDWTPAPEDIGTSQPIMSGNYGLRVTADGFQKTTDGGATWTTADI